MLLDRTPSVLRGSDIFLGRMSMGQWGSVSRPSSGNGVVGTRKGRGGRCTEFSVLWRLWAPANSALNAQRWQHLDQLFR